MSFGPPSLARPRKRSNRNKHRVAVDRAGNPRWQEVSRGAFSYGIVDAVDAYWRWKRARGDSSRGIGFPRFRRRGRDADRYRVTTGAFSPADRRHVKIPRVGPVRAHENSRRLHRLLVLERGRLLNVTIRLRGKRMLAVFTVEPMGPQ